MKQISDDPNEMDIHSPFDKVRFLIQYIGQRNQQSLNIGLVGFFIIFTIRLFKKHAAKQNGRLYKYAVFIPEIMLVVAGSTILCQHYRWIWVDSRHRQGSKRGRL